MVSVAGARAAANSIAWTAALIFWWAGLAYNRGPLVTLDAFRYAYVGGILIVLALMPARPLASTTWSLRQPVAAACVLALGLAIAYANHGDTFRAANTQENYGRLAKQLAVVANIGPRAVPDDVLYTLHLGFITAGQYRELVDEYGMPFDTKVAAPDAAIVRLGNIEPRVQPRRAVAALCASTNCRARSRRCGCHGANRGARNPRECAAVRGTIRSGRSGAR